MLMIIAVTMRHGLSDKNYHKYWIDKNLKNIFEELGVLIFPVSAPVGVEEIADICSGLIVTGSPIHIDAKKYGADNFHPVDERNKEIDDLDFALIGEFSKRNKPILGICRGIQAINVYFGGTLNQNIADHKIGITNRHQISVEKGTFIWDYFRSDRALVNSIHSQVVEKVADGFKISAISDDGVIEGIEKGNIIGVQWHPEHMLDREFFEKFISICR